MSQLSCKPANGVSGSTFLSQWYWCLVNTVAEEKVILVSENDLFLTLGLGTSNARNENLRPLLNTNIPLISGNYGLRNHFWPLESRFLMRKNEKKSIFSKTPQCPILSFWILNLHIIICQFQKNPPWYISFVSFHVSATSGHFFISYGHRFQSLYFFKASVQRRTTHSEDTPHPWGLCILSFLVERLHCCIWWFRHRVKHHRG